MKSKKTVCSCGHPRDDHSVYRPLCLITGCTCDKEGRSRLPQGGTLVTNSDGVLRDCWTFVVGAES